MLIRATFILGAIGACGSSPNHAGPDGPPSPDGSVIPQTACTSPGTAEARLPACTTAASQTLDVRAGCIPSVDGTPHAEEWNDASCVALGTSGDVAYFKYAAGNVYVAFSATPACGCGMAFAFDPNHSSSFEGDEFVVDVFDDPGGTDGDRGDFVWSPHNADWVADTNGTAPAGIVSACVGNQPTPVNYEFKLPFAALGITAGTAHTLGAAINHPHAAAWPSSVTLPAGQTLPIDPSTWGALSSSANWH